MILFVEHPVFALELDRCVILLIGPLLIIEREEKSVEVEMSEIFASIVHGHRGVHQIFLFHGNLLPRLIDLLVPDFWHIAERSVKQVHYFTVLI